MKSIIWIILAVSSLVIMFYMFWAGPYLTDFKFPDLTFGNQNTTGTPIGGQYDEDGRNKITNIKPNAGMCAKGYNMYCP